MAIPPGKTPPGAPTPEYAPLAPAVQPKGFMARIKNAALYAVGQVVGMAPRPFKSTLFVIDTSEYRREHPELNSFVEHFAKGLVDYIKVNADAPALLQGVANASPTEVTEISQELLFHALDSLTKTTKLKNVLRAAIENLISTVTAFPAPEGLDKLIHAHSHGDTAQEKEAAKKELTRIFSPLAQNIALKAGLDEEALTHVVRWGSSWLASSVEKYLVDQCIDFYEKVVVSTKLDPTIQKAVDAMPEGANGIKKLSSTAAEKANPQLLKTLKENCALIAAKINETVATYELTPENQVFLAKELDATVDSKTAASQKLWSFVQEYLERAIYNGLAHIAAKDKRATGTAEERIQRYVANLILEQRFDPLLSQKIVDFQKRTELLTKGEKELEALIKDGTDPAAIRGKEDQLVKLRDGIDTEKQEWLRQAFRPLLKTLLADMGYNKAEDLPIPTLFQETLWTNLFDIAMPDLLMTYYPKLESDPLSILGEKLVKDIEPYKKALPTHYSNFISHFGAGIEKFIQKTLAGESAFLDTLAAKYAIDPKKIQTFLQIAASKTSASAKEAITGLLFHLFVNLNTKKSPNVIVGALETLCTSIVTFSQTADIALSYKKYKGAASKQEKDVAYKALCNVFEPLVTKLMQQAGCDEKGLKKILNFGGGALPDLLKPFLIDQCIETYESLIVHTALSDREAAFLQKVGGERELQIASQALAEESGPRLLKLLTEESITIAESVNSSLLQSELLPTDEAILGKELAEVFKKRDAPYATLWDFGKKTLGQLIQKGLTNLAMNSPLQSGDAKARIEAYLVTFFQTHFKDIEKRSAVAGYLETTQKLQTALLELETLKKEALSAAEKLTKAQESAIIKKIAEVKELEEQYQPQKEAIRALFRPLVSKVMRDFGYASAADLHMPDLIQDDLWQTLTDRALPDLLVNSFRKLNTAIMDISRPLEERGEHIANLQKRFPNRDNPADEPRLVKTARPFAQLALKQLQAASIVNAKTWAGVGVEEAGLKLYEAPGSRVAARELEAKQEEIGVWAADRIPQAIAAAQSKQYTGVAIENSVEALFVKLFDNVTGNLDKIQQDNPAAAFKFTLGVMNTLTEHLKLINKIKQESNVSHMYMVDPLKMLEEFEKAGKKDPALPGYKLQTAAHYWEEQIKGFEHELIILEGEIKKDSAKIEKAQANLAAARSSLEVFQKQAEETMKSEFYNEFSPYILSLSGFTKAEDLPVPKEMQQQLWDLLVTEYGPKIMLEALKSALQPEMLNNYLKLIVESLNENLKSQEQAPKIAEENKEMIKACSQLLEQVITALPGTLILNITSITQLNDTVIAQAAATAMRTALKNYNFSALLEDSLFKAAQAIPEQLEALDSVVTKTATQIQAEKEREARLAVKSYREQAGEVIFSLRESYVNWIGDLWATGQRLLDDFVHKYLGGDTALYFKSGLDKVCRLVFIELIAKPTFMLLSIPFLFLYWVYSFNIVHHAEHLRRNTVEVPIHANLLLQVARQFKQYFPR